MTELKGMSYAELRALLEETEAALKSKRTEELKVLADGYAKKLQMGGFNIAEGIEALKPYLPAKAAKAPSAPGDERKAKYANPADPTQTWVGLGKPPQWFRDQIANGRAREDMQIP
ncbi:H-NS histone family protein [Rhizobacter sp. SG703]|uniref:H-NS histone family protein n=1 Tax=Rhizobacter sp. SG703 TaxID=2587140 RepID=UPI001447CC5F|nr:H-NS histone family protein [Rhizobacter sp. SG703]NKI92452.1 DNA-binding protein H-NS [Rhizobacter sp. SG703]